MTIKPIVNQKSSEKKENHGHGHGHSQHQENDRQQNIVQGGRTNRNKTSVEVQNSQLRNDVFDDITRHRRSPHKILGRSKRNDHHHHHKRDQREREKICASPHPYGTVANCSSNSLVVSSSGTSSSKSPKHQHMLSSSTSTIAGSNHQLQQNTVAQQCSRNQLEETFSGYNSGDEHLVPGDTLLTPDEWKIRDEQFVKAMSERGFIIQDIVEDGACLFRAISLQIYGDQEMHEVIRQQTMDYIFQNREYFAHFVTEDINSYVKRKRNKDSHGNHIEIQAMSEIYNRPVELYCYKTTPINIFNSAQINNGYDPLRLSYQRGSHYNAILDPYNASVGVGLGLADYKPESQTREAIRLSEQLEIEKTMFEDKLKTTDWEATNEAIEEQIARESYLQWCRENMQRAASNSNKINQNKLSSTQNCTSSTVTSAEAQNTSNSNPNLNLNSNSNIKNNNNCETITSCNDTTSSKDLLLAGNSNMGNNSNNNIGNLNKNNSDYEKISDQSLKTSLTKKKDCSGNCSSKNKDLIGNNKDNGIPSECNSPYDSDDTDMSSTSSVDQYHFHHHHNNHTQRFTKSSKSQQRLSKKLKRHHGDIKRKRQTEETNESKNCPMKRSRNYVRHHLDKIQEESVQNEFKCDNNKLDKKHQDNDDFKRAIGTSQRVLAALASTTAAEKTSAATTVAPIQNKVSELPCTSKQAEADCKPISRFYQSLLESSYTEDGMGQLSENEMLQKALEMSRMDFIEEQKRKFADEFYSTHNNDRRINNDTAADEDSDTLST